MTNFILSVTGHRPPKLGGYDRRVPKRVWVKGRMREEILRLAPSKGITGMALGGDQDFAELCIELDIPFIAAVPCEGQERLWLTAYQRYYHSLLAKAVEVVIVSPGPYEPWKMDARNRWMVDNSDHQLAVWDGSEGGTGNCVCYAKKVGRAITRVDPREFRG